MTFNPRPAVTRLELFSWCMFDFANSGYTTVVLTAIYNSFFVAVIAGSLEDKGAATLLWSITSSVANALVLLSAPFIGAIVDFTAAKKRFLLATTAGCVLATCGLYFTGPGDIALAMTLVIIANIMFYSGENLIAAFLPEISPPEKMGRISSYGWTLGYFGGLLALVLCLLYINVATAQGQTAAQFVPVTMLIVAALFAVAALPTLFWLRERATAMVRPPGSNLIALGYRRVRHTLQHARHYQDLFRFLIALTVYNSGIMTVIVLAAIYAQEVMGFTTQETIMLIIVVNLSAAAGAAVFGWLQDRIGSKKSLTGSLSIWIVAMGLAYFTEDRASFWLVANLIGLAMGAAQSAGRALVGLFSPPERSGEFFGLWGLATKLAAVIGPLCYGLISYLTDNNHRLALLATTLFFVAGLALLFTVDEQRGKAAAEHQA